VEQIRCPICGLTILEECGHLVADIDITFGEIHGGALVRHLDDIEEPPSISELYPLLIKAGGTPVYNVVEGGPGLTSENWWVFSDDPEKVVRISLALATGSPT
jgi:hypothetical protein